MSEIRISTESIRSVAERMRGCADRMSSIEANTNSATKLIENGVTNSSIGNMRSKMTALRNKVKTLHSNLEANYELLMKTVRVFELADKKLKEDQALDLVIEKYNKKEKIDISSYPRKRNGVRSNGVGYYFLYEDGCTWYAFSRWSEVNGKDPVFAGHPGNASNWANSIDKNAMNCVSTSVENSIVANAIAVNSVGGNHVVYIEGVRDGMVYFSESAYSNPSIAGRISAKPIEQFRSEFEYIITSK
ncbi:MAG: CHAP domain-containing protein [Clostridiales bacterium]|nr:CHAP domain-containing protein [Clostridiales bacterium]